MSDAAIKLIKQTDSVKPASVFGNPYAASPFCSVKNLIVCYEDEPIIHDVAANMLRGTNTTERKITRNDL